MQLLIISHYVTYRTNLTETGNIEILNPFTYTSEDTDKIKNFDVLEKSKEKVEKVKVVDGTHCTLVLVGGKYLQKIEFRNVLKMVDKIRKWE